MSKISASTPGLPSSEILPWDSQERAEVHQLRRAITAHMHDEPVDTDVAPMLPDLLARLDTFASPSPAPSLHHPSPPDPANPPTPNQAMAALTRVCSKARAAVAANAQNPAAGKVRDMLDLVERYVATKREVLLRAAQNDP